MVFFVLLILQTIPLSFFVLQKYFAFYKLKFNLAIKRRGKFDLFKSLQRILQNLPKYVMIFVIQNPQSIMLTNNIFSLSSRFAVQTLYMRFSIIVTKMTK